ncbi:MAG: hypothetical protein JST75_15445 [Bacteroidetes bacterium]|nr:hypothetical protein [Bacteroidota bacterium]
MQTKGKIILTRPSAWMNRFRTYSVFIDDVHAGTIKNGSSEEFLLTPGTHSITCKIAWYSSPVFSISMEQDSVEYLLVKSGIRYYSLMLVCLFAGIIINLFYSQVMNERPLGIFILQLTLILPALLYMLYYLTVGKKNYLIIEEDKDNFFAS